MSFRRKRINRDPEGYLDGQMLVAMPGMADERFSRSVIYVCSHSSDGAMGIVVNHKSQNIAFADLMIQLRLIDQGQAIMLPEKISQVQVLNGGPVEKHRGFVLHSADFFIDSSSLPLDEGIALTITIDILKAIATGSGPKNAVVALGYAGWGPGQLEKEMQDNGWLHCPADPKLIFDTEHDTKYERAMRSIGIDPRMLSNDIGHA